MGRHRVQGLGSLRQRASVQLLALKSVPGGTGLTSAADARSLVLGARFAGRTGVSV